MTTEQENIKGLVLVPCVICERTPGKIPFLNVKDSYPITMFTNSPTPMGLKATAMPMYLCAEHYALYAREENQDGSS